MVNLHLDEDMNVIKNETSPPKILGKIVYNENGYHFEKSKRKVGFLCLPTKLTDGEEESLCWLLKEFH